MRLLSLIFASRRDLFVAVPAAAAATPRDLVGRGMRDFELGRVDSSLEAFDAAIKADSSLSTKLWQRGLSLYYADRFEDAARQFKDDVAENPRDTEEAIWNYLSEAREVGSERARANIIRIEGEPRRIMQRIYQMFVSGDPTQVLASADSGSPAEQFYSALYLGLFYESLGDRQKDSAFWIDRATDPVKIPYQRNDYMRSVASVHQQLRR